MHANFSRALIRGSAGLVVVEWESKSNFIFLPHHHHPLPSFAASSSSGEKQLLVVIVKTTPKLARPAGWLVGWLEVKCSFSMRKNCDFHSLSCFNRRGDDDDERLTSVLDSRDRFSGLVFRGRTSETTRYLLSTYIHFATRRTANERRTLVSLEKVRRLRTNATFFFRNARTLYVFVSAPMLRLIRRAY